jgi:hypothetical protein
VGDYVFDRLCILPIMYLTIMYLTDYVFHRLYVWPIMCLTDYVFDRLCIWPIVYLTDYIFDDYAFDRLCIWRLCIWPIHWILSFILLALMCKGKAVPLQAWSGPQCSRKLKFADFLTTAQDGGKVVSLTHRPHLPPGNTPVTHFC